MEKRYQVFVSSTYNDLIEERRAVIQALLELDCIPAGMEMFPASDDDSWTLIQRVIDDCDYYLVIVGGRYGSVDLDGLGYTEKEYDYALGSGKPVLGFLHKDPGSIQSRYTESNPKLNEKLSAFREKVQQRQCKYWANAHELGVAVTTSYVRLIKTHPAEGWVKARYIKTTEDAEKTTQLLEQVRALEKELTALRSLGVYDTSMLSQGADTVSLEYHKIVHGLGGDKTSEEAYSFQTTWNDIFKNVGIACSELASEIGFSRALSALIEGDGPQNIYVAAETIKKVTLQFLCLGLIEKRAIGMVQDQPPPSFTGSGYSSARPVKVWALTEIGRNLLAELVASKRAASA